MFLSEARHRVPMRYAIVPKLVVAVQIGQTDVRLGQPFPRHAGEAQRVFEKPARLRAPAFFAHHVAEHVEDCRAFFSPH